MPQLVRDRSGRARDRVAAEGGQLRARDFVRARHPPGGHGTCRRVRAGAGRGVHRRRHAEVGRAAQQVAHPERSRRAVDRIDRSPVRVHRVRIGLDRRRRKHSHASHPRRQSMQSVQRFRTPRRGRRRVHERPRVVAGECRRVRPEHQARLLRPHEGLAWQEARDHDIHRRAIRRSTRQRRTRLYRHTGHGQGALNRLPRLAVHQLNRRPRRPAADRSGSRCVRRRRCRRRTASTTRHQHHQRHDDRAHSFHERLPGEGKLPAPDESLSLDCMARSYETTPVLGRDPVCYRSARFQPISGNVDSRHHGLLGSAADSMDYGLVDGDRTSPAGTASGPAAPQTAAGSGGGHLLQ